MSITPQGPSMNPSMATHAEPRVKLRSTCDACSVAKVKCDKRTPCERCQTNGFKCTYSPSRRHGKQSWAKRVAEQDINLLHSPMHSAATSSSLANILIRMPQQFGGSTGLVTPGESQIIPAEFVMEGHGMESHNEYPSSTLGGLQLDDGFEFLPQWGTMDSGTEVGTSSVTAFTPTFSESDTASTLDQQSQTHDCEAKAFAALHSLHYCTMIHSERPITKMVGPPQFGQVSNHMPPLDRVLFFNQIAVSTVRKLLECGCAHQPHLLLLYMTIMSKALFWYRLAGNPDYTSLPPSHCSPRTHDGQIGSDFASTVSVGTSVNPSNAMARNVKATKIQIGIFSLGEDDQKLLLRGILLREVLEWQSRLVTGPPMVSLGLTITWLRHSWLHHLLPDYPHDCISLSHAFSPRPRASCIY